MHFPLGPVRIVFDYKNAVSIIYDETCCLAKLGQGLIGAMTTVCSMISNDYINLCLNTHMFYHVLRGPML